MASASNDRKPPRAVEVLLVDDDRAACYSLWALLGWQPGIHICATAETAADAERLVRELRPHVCLISARCALGHGMRIAYDLARQTEAPRVLIYADHPGAELQARAVLAGVHGVIWRYGDPDQLADTIKRRAAGERQLPTIAPEVIDKLLGRVEDRDRPIVAMLLLGTPPDEVAATLGLSARQLRARRHELVVCLEPSSRELSACRLERPVGQHIAVVGERTCGCSSALTGPRAA